MYSGIGACPLLSFSSLTWADLGGVHVASCDHLHAYIQNTLNSMCDETQNEGLSREIFSGKRHICIKQIKPFSGSGNIFKNEPSKLLVISSFFKLTSCGFNTQVTSKCHAGKISCLSNFIFLTEF